MRTPTAAPTALPAGSTSATTRPAARDAGPTFPEVRLRTRLHPGELQGKVGKILGPRDLSVLLAGSCRVLKPDGELLCLYLKEALPAEVVSPEVREVLSRIRMQKDNRQLASGSQTVRVGKQKRRRPVMSNVVGAIQSADGRNYRCRLTQWTGKHLPEYQLLWPLCRAIADLFREHVPDRYRVQAEHAARTRPEWVIPGTPFTTLTVNNSFATGVHKDAGDLASGFSCLAVLRRGDYRGGILTFPEYRVGVDLQDRDVLLMDAHGEWHGNTELELGPDAERLSLVAYFREKMVHCGSPEAELAKHKSVVGRVPQGRVPRERA